MARDVTHLGQISAGVSAEIISNVLSTSTVALVREALAISRAAGLGERPAGRPGPPDGGEPGEQQRDWIRRQEAEYTTGRAGMVAMRAKDPQVARSLAAEVGAAAPLAGFLVSEVVPEFGRERPDR